MWALGLVSEMDLGTPCLKGPIGSGVQERMSSGLGADGGVVANCGSHCYQLRNLTSFL